MYVIQSLLSYSSENEKKPPPPRSLHIFTASYSTSIALSQLVQTAALLRLFTKLPSLKGQFALPQS